MNKTFKNFKTTKLEDMPYEVLENIFHRLSVYEVQHNLALVSKQFLKVSRIPGMVNNVRIIIGPGQCHEIYSEDKKISIALAKAKLIVKVHPTAKIDLVYIDLFGHERSYLLYAAKETRKNLVPEVKFLLDHLDDTKLLHEYGTTPLHESAHVGNIVLTKIFLQYNPTWVNATTPNNKWTPLHCIAASNNPSDCDEKQTTEILLKHGADPNALSVDNETPLHVCAGFGFTPWSSFTKGRILLEYGAAVDIKNRFGETALDIVKRGTSPPISIYDKQRMIDILENYYIYK